MKQIVFFLALSIVAFTAPAEAQAIRPIACDTATPEQHASLFSVTGTTGGLITCYLSVENGAETLIVREALPDDPSAAYVEFTALDLSLRYPNPEGEDLTSVRCFVLDPDDVQAWAEGHVNCHANVLFGSGIYVLASFEPGSDAQLRWSCFFGQVCGLAKM